MHSSFKPYDLIYVPTLRRIPSRLAEYKDEYGEGGDATIIDNLAKWAAPTHAMSGERKKFDKIQNFLRRVLRRDNITLTVPHNKETIVVHEYNRTLPIEALGTGIHQLVILAATALLHDDAVVCIEEPELHLHPELQHQFMHFISEETSNQYFITTHSAHIMDAPGSSVYNVVLRDGVSAIEKPLTPTERHRVCYALGYRPSALLQSNSLIWVEGPSDRLYLLHWLKAEYPKLEEGWHFSVMFYGGRLLSNIAVTDTTVEDFVSVLPINRFPAILIDSDKQSNDDSINFTKSRVIEEVKQHGGLSWVTSGREIENYVPRSLREKALHDILGEEFKLASKDNVFGKPLALAGLPKNLPKVDKLAVARHVCQQAADLSVLDLREKVTSLADFICMANRIPLA